ncbi:hypothetical protein HY969_00240 [Candidatus Kaiserbacteria bacterium]|nr:hypothetical protein [Candidatus Kaiserbacteria bacterium]
MGKKHLLKCWLWKILWGLSVLAFALAWVSVLRKAPIGQFDPLFLFWNALILGVLAVPIKLDCQTCETCSVAPPRAM